MNLQLIQDEGHRNPMQVHELEQRMHGWLSTEYEAVLFESDSGALAYALYCLNEDFIHLRQFFVDRNLRRRGIGREGVRILIEEVWPPDKRITVSALIHNEQAVQFWRKVGFLDYSLSLERHPVGIRKSA
jgi:GNAT superfamily N-acetyltransferase